MQHDVFGVQHVLPADILVVPNVFRRSYRCHGLNREGITCLREGESVVADGPVGVSGGFPASSRSEVVEFYIFQVIDFVEGVRGWPGLDVFLYATLWIVRVQLRLLLLSFPATVPFVFLLLGSLGFCLFAGHPV